MRRNPASFSQFRCIRLDVNGDINRACYLLIQGLFQLFSDLVGSSDFQIRVNEDVQIEKDFPADRAGPQLVPLPDRRIGVDDTFNLLDRVRIDGGLGQLTQRIAIAAT